MKKFGLFIGINRYRHFKAEQHLHCAEADACALADVFAGLGFVTKVLCDVELGYEGNGNHELIFEQLQSWKNELAPNEESLLLLYFAGHGCMVDGKQFFLAPKAPLAALDEPGHAEVGVISEARLRKACARWSQTRRVLVFDACRTPFLLKPVDDAQVGTRGLAGGPLREVFVEEQGLAVLRACPQDQVAFELRHFGTDKKSHGLYTAALLDILQQKASNDEAVLLDDGLNHQIGSRMRELARLHAPAEHQARVEKQQPLRQGDVICLADAADFIALKIKQYLLEFEAHFVAGRYYRPAVQSCSHTLWQLQELKYAQDRLLQLSARLESAHAAQREAERQAHTTELLNSLEQRLMQAAQDRGAAQALAVAHSKIAELEQGKVASDERIGQLQQAMQQLTLDKQRAVEQTRAALAAQAAAQEALARQATREAILELTKNVVKASPDLKSRAAGDEFRDVLTGGGSGPLMVVVPPGQFQIGSDLADDEKNGPLVKIAKAFAVGKFPITVGQYLAAVNAGQCREPEWREVGSKYHYQTGSDDHYRKLGKALLGKR